MSSSSDQFAVLQNALQQLNYSQPLLRQSVPLAHALFTDLVEVTRKYQQTKVGHEKSEAELSQSLQLLKRENTNLLSSNNDLHLKIMKENENYSSLISKLKKQLQQSKLETNEFNFLQNQKNCKIESQNIEIMQLKKKVHLHLNMNKKSCSTKTPQTMMRDRGSHDDHFMHDSESELEEKQQPQPQQKQKQTQQQQVSLSPLKNENCMLLARLKQLNRDFESERSQVLECEQMIKDRDRQILRLSQSQSQSQSHQSSELKGKYAAEDSVLRTKHLSEQISVLENELRQKEMQCKKLSQNTAVLMQLKVENKKLSQEKNHAISEMEMFKKKVIDIKQTSLQLQREKKSDIARIRSNQKISVNLSELQRLQNRIAELQRLQKVQETKYGKKDKQCSILSENFKKVSNEKFTLDLTLDVKQKEIAKKELEYNALLKERNSLREKLATVDHARDLNVSELQNQKIVLKSCESKYEFSERTNARLTKENVSLLSDLKACRLSNDALKKKNQHRLFEVKKGQQEIADLHDKIGVFINDKQHISTDKNSLSNELFLSAKQLQESQFANIDLKNENELVNKQLLEYNKKLNKLEQQCNEYSFDNEKNKEMSSELLSQKNELQLNYNLLNKRCLDVERKYSQSLEMIESLNVVSSALESSKLESSNIELEFKKLLNLKNSVVAEKNRVSIDLKHTHENLSAIQSENKQLKTLLQQTQSQIQTLQKRIALLTEERDYEKALKTKIQMESENQNEMIHRLNIAKNLMADEKSKYQNEHRFMGNECVQMKKENKILHEQLLGLNEKMSKFVLMEKNINRELQNEMNNKKRVVQTNLSLMDEKNDLLSSLSVLKNNYQALASKYELLDKDKVLMECKNNELKILCQQLSENNKLFENRVSKLFRENQLLNEMISSEKLNCVNLQNEIGVKNERLSENECAIKNLVHKYDEIQNLFDSKLEIIQALQNDLRIKSTKMDELKNLLSDIQEKYRQQRQILFTKENEINRFHQSVEQLSTKMSHLISEKNIMSEQLSQMSVDFENMNKENVFLNREYSQTVVERDNTKKEIQSIVHKILYLEEQASVLEREKSEILKNYKNVCLENERYLNITRDITNEKNDFKLQMNSMNDQIFSRDLRIESLEKKLSETAVSNNILSRNCQQLNRDLERCNESIAKNNNTTQILQNDLNLTKNAEVMDKQNLAKYERAIPNLQMEIKQCNEVIARLEMDKKIAFESVKATDEKVFKLEEIIQNMRISQISTKENKLRERDDANHLKSELNEMKDLNNRLQHQLTKMKTVQ